MDKLIILPDVLDWHEIGRVFLIISLIAFFVSIVINECLSSFPVFAAQLSILATLFLFPMINFYTLLGTDYDILGTTGKADPSNYGAIVFLAPLPTCIFITAVFLIFRNRKPQKNTSKQPGKVKLLLRVVPCIISLTVGSTWLSITMLFEKTAFHITLAMFMFYTILGFIMYLVSEVVLSVVKHKLEH